MVIAKLMQFHSNNKTKAVNLLNSLTLLLRQITGHKEHPKVQQQQRQPQNNHFTFTGRVFFNTAFILITVSLNSSGATLDTNPLGNSVLNLLLKPNLKIKQTYSTNLFRLCK